MSPPRLSHTSCVWECLFWRWEPHGPNISKNRESLWAGACEWHQEEGDSLPLPAEGWVEAPAGLQALPAQIIHIGVRARHSEPWCLLGRREAEPLGAQSGGPIPSTHHPLSARRGRTEHAVAAFHQKLLSWSSRK